MVAHAETAAKDLLLQRIAQADLRLEVMARSLDGTSNGATAKARGFYDYGIRVAAENATPAGPAAARAAEAMTKVTAGLRTVANEVKRAGGAPTVEQVHQMLKKTFKSAENLIGLIDQATGQTRAGNAALELGTGSDMHEKSTTGSAFLENLKVLGPIREAVVGLITAGKQTAGDVVTTNA